MDYINDIAPLADMYSGLKYEEKKLAARIAAAKKAILETGLTEIEGEVATVTVSDRAGSVSFDKKLTTALLRSLGATDEQIAAVMTVGEASKVLNIKANLALAA